MEFPPFNHHHHRYVPPPPPPPKNFSDDRPNVYPHHHPLLPPPPPPLSYSSFPPPPPPHPHPVPPPPPSYNPHQSHFTFLDAQNPPFHNHSRSSPPPPPRFSNQSYRFDYRNDSRSDPHRVPLELPHRNPISSDDPQRRLYSSNPQSESYYKPHVSDRVIPSSRFRDDSLSDGYISRDISNIVSQDHQVYRGSPNDDRVIDRYASARSVMNIDKSTGSSSRNLENYVEKYEPRYMTMSESERIWDLHGEENPKWVMKGKQNEFGHNDGVSFLSGREQYGEEDPKWVMKGKQNEFGHSDGASFVSGREQSRDYESSSFNKVREGREEFKQVQKKSVLLRIGKPNNTYRNKNHEQHPSKAYLVESNNSNYRGKDKDKDKVKDKDQIGKDSSVFSDQKMEADRERSPVELDVSFKSNGLIAKAVVTPSSQMSDNNHTQSRNRKIKRVTEFGSPLSKFSDRSTRSGSSSHGLDSPSSSGKAPKPVTDKDSVSIADNGSLSDPVLVQGGGSGRPDGPLSFRLRKKRKLMNLGSNAFNFQLAEKDDKSVKGESSKDSPIGPISGNISSPPLGEKISSEFDKSSVAIVSEKDDTQADNPSLSYINGFGDGSTESKNLINDGLVNDFNQQPIETENSLNLENDTEKMSTDVRLSLGGTYISSSSGQDQTEIEKCPTEAYASVDAANDSYNLCNGSVTIQEIDTTADMNSLNSCSDEIIIISPENSDVQGFLDDASRKEDEIQLLEGTSKQTCFNESSEFREDCPKESRHAVIVVEDNATPCSSHKESSFDNDEVTKMVNSISASVQSPSSENRELTTDAKDDLPPSSSIISAFANVTDQYVTISNGKSGESIPELPTSVVSSQNDSSFSDSKILTSKSVLFDSCIPKNDVSKDGLLLNGPELFVENSKTSIKTSHLDVTNTVSSASQGSSVKVLGSNTKLQRSTLPNKQPSSVSTVPRVVFAGRSTPVLSNLRTNNPLSKIAKPRTWHRSTSNPVPLPPKPIVAGQNSYVRTGNTLVRKNAPVTLTAVTNGSVPPASRSSSVYQLNPSGPIETRNSSGSSKVNHTFSRTAGPSAPVVRPKTPPLSGSTKLPDCPTFSRDLPSLPLEYLPASRVVGNLMVQKVSEDQTSNSESQKIQYVKPKSNQLVAASSSDQSIQDLDKTQACSSDSYYKRIKNQLIRTSVGDDSAANVDVHKASKNNIKRQSGKGISKKYKLLRFPSVWTLDNSQSSGKDRVSLLQEKLIPQIFPWKRSRNWGNVINNISASSRPCNSLSSSISRKLLLSRKRETIYTRSRHGFSLHMSKLLSVGGSSLKWSKSLERNSKKANEEATLAVAAAEKKKREQHGTAEKKSRNNTSRERIFRIGLVRYKMDPSRRTLQRISDEEPSTSTQSKENIRKSYVPKRLKIGHDEYVHTGNGNQLVRNPKRRTRIFANEKVRWSLHTARSRLAKKKKYCQFFTRFGKCNKDDGKCPYIHDSSKIAVCTKFLNGSCSNPNCKLTHQVIPERMQDCSYFMQGLCSNKQCPYRHVNVNSAASICEGFLKGYCADGNECRKKHTYACPVFEATGACSQGTKCKLHHPKTRLKRKQLDSMEQQQKNARGRYFGSTREGEAIMSISEEKYHSKDDDDGKGDILCQEGKFAEYISLDFGNEEVGELTVDQKTTLISDCEPSGLEAVGFDELTKPIRIMKKGVLDR